MGFMVYLTLTLAGASVLLVLKERPRYMECAKLAAEFLLGEKCLGSLYLLKISETSKDRLVG